MSLFFAKNGINFLELGSCTTQRYTLLSYLLQLLLTLMGCTYVHRKGKCLKFAWQNPNEVVGKSKSLHMYSHFPLPLQETPPPPPCPPPPTPAPPKSTHISSAHTVDKEPAGFPHGKTTSCYTLGISQMAPSPSIPQTLHPIRLSNWPHVSVHLVFLTIPSFIKGCGPSHSKCPSPHI